MHHHDGPAASLESNAARDAALDYLYGRIDYERLQAPTRRYPFRLTRMRRLLESLGNPQVGPKIVHVGGTKGKGSVSTMVAAMLTAGGFRTGLYTSPHLVQLEERFRIDGQACSAPELIALVDTVRQAGERIEEDGKGSATFFELTTAMAFQHFRNAGCDVIVLEVGLGGRLDSTNVCSPSVTAITSIGLDHQHILGETIEEIAKEKAGIIKPGIPLISGVRTAAAAPVIAATAAQTGAPLWQIGRDFDVVPGGDPAVAEEAWGSCIDFLVANDGPGGPGELRPRQAWSLALEGSHQRDNAAVALAIIDALGPQGIAPSLADQQQGLAKVVCEGRVERFPGRPEVILDTAHNDDSIAALCRVIACRRRNRATAIVFGTSRDKDAETMLGHLLPHADQLVLTRFHGNPRWLDPQPLADRLRGYPAKVLVESDPRRAIERAGRMVGDEGLVVICGSFFLAAETRPWLLQRATAARFGGAAREPGGLS